MNCQVVNGWWIVDGCFLTMLLFLQIFYFIGFALFCLESLLSIWVIQVGQFIRLQIALFFWFVLFWFLRLFLFATICSKYTCISEAVARLLRWSVMQQEGPWGQRYDGAHIEPRCYLWMDFRLIFSLLYTVTVLMCFLLYFDTKRRILDLA